MFRRHVLFCSVKDMGACLEAAHGRNNNLKVVDSGEDSEDEEDHQDTRTVLLGKSINVIHRLN